MTDKAKPVPRLSFTVIIAISIPWYTIQLLFLPPAPAKGRAKAGDGGWDAEKRKAQGYLPFSAFRFENNW